MDIKVIPGEGKKRLDNLLKGMSNREGKVGWFESAKYPNGTPVAQVAYWQEFSIRDGLRSFMRTTRAEKGNEWSANIKKGAKAIASGGETMFSVMEKVGLGVAGDIRKKISEIDSPALEQATIDARLRKMADGVTIGNLTKPLVETANMMNTLTNTTE